MTPDGDPFLSAELYVNDPDENHVPVEREEQRHFFHGLMDAELCAAELMARNSTEHPEMPWDFHVDMARQTWDEVRHARVHEILMPTELGCRWGDYPVGFAYFRSIYRRDLLDRLALFNSTSEQKAMWRHSHRRKVLVERGQETVAKVFDYLLADEVPHVHNGVRWGAYLMEGDEKAYRAYVRELRWARSQRRAWLDRRTGRPGRDVGHVGDPSAVAERSRSRRAAPAASGARRYRSAASGPRGGSRGTRARRSAGGGHRDREHGAQHPEQGRAEEHGDDHDEALDLDRALLDLRLDHVVLELLIEDREDDPDDQADREVDEQHHDGDQDGRDRRADDGNQIEEGDDQRQGRREGARGSSA